MAASADTATAPVQGFYMQIDQYLFKAGMRKLAASVCLITTNAPTLGRAGLTATAVCSVSAEPPTLLCCINRGGSAYAAFAEAAHFAVNVLSLADETLATRFAGQLSQSERFAQGDWNPLFTGSPILHSAAVAFDCQLTQRVDVGTHMVVFGEIRAVHVSENARALLYADGGYGGFVRQAELPPITAEHPDITGVAPPTK